MRAGDARKGNGLLSEADLARARRIAEDAPPLSPEVRERVRAILACWTQSRPPQATRTEPGGDDVEAA